MRDRGTLTRVAHVGQSTHMSPVSRVSRAQKITVSADEEKAYNIETMKTFVTKKSGDLMMELEALQKNNNLSTPVSSLDMTKVLAGK